VYTDADLQRRWAGGDVDLSRRLPSDLIVAAAEAHPHLNSTIMPYFMMRALPSSLTAIEPRVREIYAGGWRPAMPEGPSRSELADLISRTDKRAIRAGRAAPRVVA
jgi:hypothetical protein